MESYGFQSIFLPITAVFMFLTIYFGWRWWKVKHRIKKSYKQTGQTDFKKHNYSANVDYRKAKITFWVFFAIWIACVIAVCVVVGVSIQK